MEDVCKRKYVKEDICVKESVNDKNVIFYVLGKKSSVFA